MRRVATWEFQDLPGRPGKTRCRGAHSVTEALRLLRKGLPISAAGERGSLNCYVDADGKLRGVFSRYCITRSDQQFSSWAELCRWLRQWFPELGDQKRLARI